MTAKKGNRRKLFPLFLRCSEPEPQPELTTRRFVEQSLIPVNRARAGERARARQKVVGFVDSGIDLEFRLRHLHGFGRTPGFIGDCPLFLG